MDADGKPDSELVRDIQQYCYEHGVLIWKAGRQNNVVRLLPPLVMTKSQADIDIGIGVLVETIRTYIR